MKLSRWIAKVGDEQKLMNIIKKWCPFLILALLFPVLWYAMVYFLGFGINIPYIWLITLLFIFLLCRFAIKKTKVVGIILSALTIFWFIQIISGSKEILCWNHDEPENVNEIIDISYLSEEERTRYIWMYDNYQPGQKITIGRGWKATLDCEAEHTIPELLGNVFINNWW